MPQSPVIFLSRGSAEKLSQQFDSNFNDISLEEKKRLIFFEELLFKKGKVYVDFDLEKFITTELTEFVSHKERQFASFIQKLSMVDKLSRCIDGFFVFTNCNVNDFDNLKIKPHYLFLNADRNFCKEISEVMGIICISNDFYIHEDNISVVVKIIEKGVDTNYNREYLQTILQNLYTANSIVIEDPYIFDNDMQCNYVDDLLANLNASTLKARSFVTFIFSNNDCKFNKVNFVKLEERYKKHNI